MNYSCPYCDKPLGKKLMIWRATKGQRKFLLDTTVPVCVYCKEELEINEHPKERFLRVMPLIATMIALYSMKVGNKLFIYGSVLLMLFILAWMIKVSFQEMNSCNRFKKRSREK